MTVIKSGGVRASGVEISRVGLGGYELGPEPGDAPDVERAVRVIESAIANGVNWLDTSENYLATNNESVIGQALDRPDAIRRGHTSSWCRPARSASPTTRSKTSNAATVTQRPATTAKSCSAFATTKMSSSIARCGLVAKAEQNSAVVDGLRPVAERIGATVGTGCGRMGSATKGDRCDRRQSGSASTWKRTPPPRPSTCPGPRSCAKLIPPGPTPA